jgi:hypothetical protein
MEKVRVVDLRTYQIAVIPKLLDFRDYYLPRSIAIRVFENFDEAEIGTDVEEMPYAVYSVINDVRVKYHHGIPFDPDGIRGKGGMLGPVDLRTRLPGPPCVRGRLGSSHF